MKVIQTIQEVLDEHPDDDVTELAKTVIARCTKADLLYLVIRAINDEMRDRDRYVEQQAFKVPLQFNNAAWSVPSPVELSSLDSFKALYKTTIRLGDGTATTWGRATLGQHEQRIAMLTVLRNGLNRTIERHQEAVQILRATGAPCLEEVVTAAA